MEHVPGRSINLAMAVRGLGALNKIELDNHVQEEYGIPMYARMIHNTDGKTNPIPYGKENQCIYSVGRRYVNEILLDQGSTYDDIHFHFQHKLLKANLEKPELTFERQDVGESDNKLVTVKPDLVIGCDGAFSAVRKEMMKKPRFNYSQTYIPHAYMELCMPPVNGDFAMPPNYLHIWPRGQFMMIGLPNQDKSFTMTLFMPKITFDGITNGDDLVQFFEEYFPDSIPLLGKEKMIEDYFNTRPLPLISIKCSPYHLTDKCLIMGDAAHAMVPFYGQGMNCGMEDVLVLDEMFKRYPNDRKKVFEEYSKHRNPDAEAMCDLAMYNYIEMRDLVARRSFLLRKLLDNFLYWIFPRKWVPLYTSVTFTRMRYHHCISNKKWQDELLGKIGNFMAMSSIAAGLGGLFWLETNIQLSRGLLEKLNDII